MVFPGSLFGRVKGSDTGLSTGGKSIRYQGQLAAMWATRTLQIFPDRFPQLETSMYVDSLHFLKTSYTKLYSSEGECFDIDFDWFFSD